jgi:hypothetical protein
MWWTIALRLIGSKAGIAVLAVIALLGLIGWHKIEVAALEHRIATLKTDIQQVEGRVIEELHLKQACQYILSDLRNTVTRQNQAIATLEQEATALEQAASQRVRVALTPPEEIERRIQGPPGNEAMNRFMSELAGRLAR